MGKTGKWLRSFLTGKKDHKEKENEKGSTTNEKNNPSAPSENVIITPAPLMPATPKEKRRWSFRRSSATAPRDSTQSREAATTPPKRVDVAVDKSAVESEEEQKKQAVAVAAATTAAADAQAAAAVIRLTTAVEETAAVKIQAYFRAYLARKALRALKGLVKLQALVRGHLVRKQATATLKCMQALVTLQAKARAQRLRMVEEEKPTNQRLSTHRKSTQESRIKNTYYENDKGIEENIKIVEMDIGETRGNPKSRSSYSNHSHYASHRAFSGYENYQFSPAPSAITDMSPRACSGHFEDYNSFSTAQSSPQCYSSAVSRQDFSKLPFSFPHQEHTEAFSYDYPLFPNYMANTESSRAKARSQSAPKQRPPELYERQPSRGRRASMEGRSNVPRAVKMQRSSSHVGSTAKDYQYPWSNIKLDRSNVSLKESECGSTSTVLTNANYCRSLVAFDVHGNRY